MGAGLVLSSEEEKDNLTAARNCLKDGFAAKFFSAMADVTARANGHIYSLGAAGWALGRHLWEGGAALCQIAREVEGLHPCRLSRP